MGAAVTAAVTAAGSGNGDGSGRRPPAGLQLVISRRPVELLSRARGSGRLRKGKQKKPEGRCVLETDAGDAGREGVDEAVRLGWEGLVWFGLRWFGLVLATPRRNEARQASGRRRRARKVR